MVSFADAGGKAVKVACVVSAAVAAARLASWLAARVQYVGKDEQLLLKLLTEKVVVNGPAVRFPSVFTTLSYKKRKAVVLSETQYCVTRDSGTGAVSVIAGPALHFLGPYEEVDEGGVCEAEVLTAETGVHVQDAKTGEVRLVTGPATFVPGPTEAVVRHVTAVALKADEYLRVQDKATGRVWLERGECIFFPQPTHELAKSTPERAFRLLASQSVRLIDSLSGAVRVERGEQLVFPAVTESPLDNGVINAIDLRAGEYVVLRDTATGQRTVERGPKQVWLSGTDRVVGDGKERAVCVDAENAALVQDRRTGELSLVTEPGLVWPTEHTGIVEVRQLIRLTDNEAIVLKDESGVYHFRYGDPKRASSPSDAQRSFFLPPHWEVVELRWSRGRRRERKDLIITTFDMRPQFMSFEFNCRTSDNVELVLEGTFFWEVVDLPEMLRFTGDAPGDVCAHARSCFIQLVSKVTLAQFMDTFNTIARDVHTNDDGFYQQRGIKIHSLEVTRYQCADESTAKILQKTVEETTNRLCRLTCQESENEVALARLKGELEEVKASAEVLEVRQKHAVESAKSEGLAEAERVVAFLSAVSEGFVGADGEQMWRTLRKNESLAAVANGSAHVVFAPQDAKLSFTELGANS